MLRFPFSAAGGAQLRIPVTRISVPMELEPLNTSKKENPRRMSEVSFLVHFQGLEPGAR